MNDCKLKVDAADFRGDFGHRPFRLQHALADHPLFQVERLIELSKALPPERVEWNAGSVPLVIDPKDTPSNGLTAEETIRRIAECGSWLVLKHVQLDDAYRELLVSCIDELSPMLRELGHEPFRPQGFIFVSSPGAVTPFHIDPENNFLIQVRGQKTMYTHDREDRTMLSDEDRERFAAGGHRNLRADEASLAHAETFVLKPGDGLHVPLHTPHFVRNGEGVSISFSVTFQTRASDAEHGVLWCNHKLRRIGLRPRPYGVSPGIDRLKHGVFGGLRGLKRLL
ncbi:Cupin superfamily protein [Planctomycetes bacterium Poly30]|uniref:Cupin superfamily protein n=1 Tax=Saltatorellus ferox TaxID=2528018 RepID=A0A518EM86_9BACT|nr:Cupin superfamily protein [Planctomycetes bacterium Poly30]